MGFAFVIFTIVIGIVPLLILFFRKPKQSQKHFITAIKPFLWLLFIGAIYEIVFTAIFYVNTDLWMRLYYLLEFLTLCYFFRKLFENRYKYVLIAFLIVFTVAWLAACVLWFKIQPMKADGYLAVLETIFVYTFVVLWLKELFLKMEIESLWQAPIFYVICGFVLYFVGTVFMFLMISDIFNITRKISKYWLISNVLNLFMRTLLFISVWKATQKKPD